MRLFNTTIICGLILSKYTDRSPLLLFSHQSFTPSLSFSSFQLSHFAHTALYLQTQSNLLIRKSDFSNFLKTPIIESRPPITTYERICRDRRNPDAVLDNLNFQICSTDFYTDLSTVNTSGGALFFDVDRNSITITQCNFAYCHAAINGGAIYITYASQLIIKFTYFQDCTTGFLHNHTDVSEAKGGAIYANCLVTNITACNFSRCTVDYDITRYGGAIYFARCSEIRSQGLYVYLSKFESCGSVSGRTSVTNGGAIYVNCTLTLRSDYVVNISYTNFTNCAYGEGGSIVDISGDADIVYFRHVQFGRDQLYQPVYPRNDYYIVNVNNSRLERPTKLFLYNVSLTENNVEQQPVVFHMLGNNISIAHGPSDVGSIYLSRDNGNYALLNGQPINMLAYVNLYNISRYSYPYIVALEDNQIFVPFATPTASATESPTPALTSTPTPQPTSTTSAVTSSSNTSESSSSGILPPSEILSATGVIDDSQNSASTKSGGLSTAAIVLIVIAVIIIIITAILITVLCIRNGRCGGSKNQIMDVRSATNDEAIRRFTYF